MRFAAAENGHWDAMRIRTVLAAAALSACSACVLPARSFGAYEEKAVTTAEAVASAVQNANLAVSLAAQRRAFAPYITTLLDESENDASSAQSTFGSIQPPDDHAIALFGELDPILEDAVHTISALRIAARGGRLDVLPRGRGALRGAATKLDAFLKALA
jgi:hypothetical protein